MDRVVRCRLSDEW